MDLNLLRVFVAVYEEGSLSGAADRMHLTQPTISYTCQKLRRHYGDPMFVRTGRGVRPTSFAEGLYHEVSEHLHALEARAAQGARFDPATSQRAFVLCLSDLGESSFLPDILARLQREAPEVTVQCLPVDIATAGEKLSRGEADVVITSGRVQARTESQVIHPDRYCLVHHPGVRESLERRRFAEVPFIFAHPSLGHHPPVQRLLETAGLPEANYSTVQSFSSLPYILSRYVAATVAPELVARQWRTFWPQLGLTPLPGEDWSPEVRLHRRAGPANPALEWFCSLVLEAAQGVGTSLS